MSNNFNHFSEIANALTPFCGQCTKNTAQNVVDTYEATAPRDTGAMAESGYIVTSQESTYDQAHGPTRPDAYLLPEVEAPDNDTDAVAAIAMNYSEFVELGTSRMSPQPAFYPAVESATASFEAELGGFEDYLKQQGLG